MTIAAKRKINEPYMVCYIPFTFEVPLIPEYIVNTDAVRGKAIANKTFLSGNGRGLSSYFKLNVQIQFNNTL